MVVPRVSPYSRRPTARLGSVLIGGDEPVVLMGALNVSPESFYAGSIRLAIPELRATAAAMVEAGARIIDIGAMSTAPYRRGPVSADEEDRRLGDAVRALVPGLGVPVSADTGRSGPARTALEAGAEILNDVTGLADPELARLAAARGASLILTASPAAARAGRVVIDADDPLGSVQACLAASLARALDAGVPADRIVLDPGIGFFLDDPDARADWDVRVLAGLAVLGALGRPLAVGVSRKSFLGTITRRGNPDARLPGSLVATALAIASGAALVRAHDAPETRDAILVAERIVAAGRPTVTAPFAPSPCARNEARR